jgi:hypothetical protein
MARIFAALFTLFALPAFADDNGRVSVLEQEMRNLKRDVQNLSRQLDDLRARPDRIAAPSTESRAAAPPFELPQWVNAAKWQGLRPGMSELEVISALGAPTSMREEDGVRVLLYAMEIGASGFLGGGVKLRDRAVFEIRQPSLQ